MSEYPQAVHLELGARQVGESDKALRKYGQDALLPGGRPEFDVLDYAINEVVGLLRYGEMIKERHRQMRLLMEGVPGLAALCARGEELGEELRAAGERLALEAIDVHQRLRAKGLLLGTTEKGAL